MGVIRRLDHVAIAVRNTEDALAYFRDRLGLEVVSSEVRDEVDVRLTYLDCGNLFIQLVEPLRSGGSIATYLDQYGEGVHHLAFGVDNVELAASELSSDEAPPVRLGQGRGRVSAFVPGRAEHGVTLECTEFVRSQDVEGSAGYLS